MENIPVLLHIDDAVADFRIGQAIRQVRLAAGLTQQQLGERAGLSKPRICSIEKGCNLRLSSLRRIFTALGLNVALDIPGVGHVPLTKC